MTQIPTNTQLGGENHMSEGVESASRPRSVGPWFPATQHEINETWRTELLAREGYEAQIVPITGQPGAQTLRDWWTVAGRRVLGDHWDSHPPEGSGIRHFTINKVLPLILTHAATETEQDPSIRFHPVSMGEDPKAVYLKPKTGRKIVRMLTAGMIQLQGFSSTQLQGIDPITLDQYEILTEPDPVTQAKPLFIKSDFWVVDDALLAKVGQQLFDLHWTRGSGAMSFLENVFYTQIFGHAPWLMEIKPDPFGFIFSCPHVANVYIDPNCTKIEDAEYVIYDQVISTDRARALYPQFAPDIDRIAASGSIMADRTGIVQIGSQYSNQTWQRRMLILRHVWERNWPFPVSGDQALQNGQVQTAPWDADDAVKTGILTPLKPSAGTPAATGEPPQVDDGQGMTPTEPDQMPPVNPMEGDPAESATTNLGPLDDTPPQPDIDRPTETLQNVGMADQQEPQPTHQLEDGTQVYAGHPLWPHRYMLLNGEPVTDEDEAWPMRLGIRHVVLLRDAQRIVQEGENEFCDVPWGWNKNKPIQFMPYGQGEPVNLDDLQQFINRLATLLYNTVRYHPYPQEYMPQSVRDALQSQGVDPHSRPNNVMGLPDELYDRYFGPESKGRTSFAMPPPEPPEFGIELLSKLLETFDNVGGNVDVLQGVPRGADMSGTALAQITANAKGPLGFKSKFSADTLRRMGRLVFDAIMKYMPDKDWAAYCQEYPPHVLDVIRQTIGCADWNVEAELGGSYGANRQQTRSQTLEEFTSVPPLIDRRTALERLDEDADLVIRRMQEEQEAAAQEQARIMQSAPQPMVDGGNQPQQDVQSRQQQGGMPLPPVAQQ